MENPNQKAAYKRIIYITIILLVFILIAFLFSTLTYFLINKLKLEENDPTIDLSGIIDFSFNYNPSINLEYTENMSNLGFTGNLILDCYKGKCNYKETYKCTKRECRNGEDGVECTDVESICESYEDFFKYNSSKLCRESNGESCNACDNMTSYTYKKCSCSESKNSKEYSTEYSCYADNIILNWKNYIYYRKNATDSGYNYLNSAFPPDQNCPSGTKQCGILDEHGNKLCYPDNVTECPINYITLDSSDNKYNYSSCVIDGVTIYYTNQATNEGLVLGGFYVDSDLKINYGDCQIISTSTIREFLDSQKNKQYRNSLNFDPYKDNNIDKKGNAYLRWCIPGFGKERNIALVKELNKVYELNKTTNNDLDELKSESMVIYIIDLVGYILLILFLPIAIWTFKKKPGVFCFPLIIIEFGLSLIIIFYGIYGSISINIDISKMDKIELYHKIFKASTSLDIIACCLKILLFIAFIAYFSYICIYRKYSKFKSDDQSDDNIKANELITKCDDVTPQNNKDLDFNAYDKPRTNNQTTNTNTYPLTPEDIY
jgi:hypothetical protein